VSEQGDQWEDRDQEHGGSGSEQGTGGSGQGGSGDNEVGTGGGAGQEGTEKGNRESGSGPGSPGGALAGAGKASTPGGTSQPTSDRESQAGEQDEAFRQNDHSGSESGDTVSKPVSSYAARRFGWGRFAALAGPLCFRPA
jgi:hypothetical protein